MGSSLVDCIGTRRFKDNDTQVCEAHQGQGNLIKELTSALYKRLHRCARADVDEDLPLFVAQRNGYLMLDHRRYGANQCLRMEFALVMDFPQSGG